MEKETTNKIIIGTAVGFLLGFGAALIWVNQKAPEVAGDNAKEIPVAVNEDENEQEGVMKAESLQVDDQKAGDTIIIGKADLKEPAWVVVYEGVDGNLGSILGARLFQEGVTEGKEVYLLRATRSGERYFTLFHRDSGDGQFDYKEDIAMREENSDRLIITSFEAQ